MSTSRKVAVALYEKVYLIRSAEKAIIKYYDENEMKTPMHMSMGEEAIMAGTCQAMGDTHQAFGYYRSHALYLAKTGDVEGFFAEMYGKATGVVRGKGGSMHMASPEHGLLGVSAVVASTVAPAVGAAFANKMKNTGKIVFAFFGDGALEEGVTLEALNVACKMKLPVLFVCADNGLAVDVTACERQGFHSIPKLIEAYQCKLAQSESTDPERIYRLTLAVIEEMETTGMPGFLHLKYYRMLQHIGIISDFDDKAPRPKGGFEKTGYRSREEYDHWMKKDPVIITRQSLIASGASEKDIQKIEFTIDQRVENAVVLAKQAPFPAASELYDHVFAPANEK